MLPSETGEVCCVPRRRLIFRFAGRVMSFKRSLRVHSVIDSLCLYHYLQTNSHGFCFNPKYLMYTSMDLSRQALQINGKFFFSNFNFVFACMYWPFRERIRRRLIWALFWIIEVIILYFLAIIYRNKIVVKGTLKFYNVRQITASVWAYSKNSNKSNFEYFCWFSYISKSV